MSEEGLTSRMPRVRNPLRPQENKPKSCNVGEAPACLLCAYAQVERYKDDTVLAAQQSGASEAAAQTGSRLVGDIDRESITPTMPAERSALSLGRKQGESDESLILQAWANKVAPGWDANDSAETQGVAAQPTAALPDENCPDCQGEGNLWTHDSEGNEVADECFACDSTGRVPSSQAAALVRNVTDAAAAAGVQSPPVEPLGESSVAASGGGLLRDRLDREHAAFQRGAAEYEARALEHAKRIIISSAFRDGYVALSFELPPAAPHWHSQLPEDVSVADVLEDLEARPR